jgi:hypothetical protein
MEFYQLQCPHCQGSVIVCPNELNCRIFRHGVYINNGNPIPPHSSKEECDRLFHQGLIMGCGRPFRVITQEDGSELAVVCDYL